MVGCTAFTRPGQAASVLSHAVWAVHLCAPLTTSNAGDLSTGCLCRAVPKESPFFLRARVVLADIYLTHKHDRAAYARCYSDLVDKHGDFDSYRLYGEALLQIQEPERAIKVMGACTPSVLFILHQHWERGVRLHAQALGSALCWGLQRYQQYKGLPGFGSCLCTSQPGWRALGAPVPAAATFRTWCLS